MKMVEDSEKILHTLSGFIYHKNKIWFVDSGCNELYSYNLADHSSRLCIKFPLEEEYQAELFRVLLFVENKLYAIPFSATALYEIDITFERVRKIDLDRCFKYEKYLDRAKFSSVHAYKSSIYMVGTTYPAIVEYNCITEEIIYYRDWIEETTTFSNSNEVAFFRKATLSENKIYAPSCKGNWVLEFNLDDKTHTWLEVGSKECTYSAICKQGDWFWLSPRGKGPIVKWNRNTKEIVEISKYPTEYKPCEGGFGDCVYFNGYIYFMPVLAKVILRVYEKSDTIEIFNIGNMDWTKSCACVCENRLYIYCWERQQFVVVDKNDKVTYHECIMSQEQCEYHKKNLSYTYGVLEGKEEYNENYPLTEEYSEILKKYIEYIAERNVENKSVPKKMIAELISQQLEL